MKIKDSFKKMDELLVERDFLTAGAVNKITGSNFYLIKMRFEELVKAGKVLKEVKGCYTFYSLIKKPEMTSQVAVGGEK